MKRKVNGVAVGEYKTNKFGTYKILEINNALDIVIEWQDEYRATMSRTADEVKKNTPKNPYFPNIFNFGFMGEGKFSWSDRKEHITWKSMIERCYSQRTDGKWSTYFMDKHVNDRWANFQNFAEWCQNQIGFKEEGWALDKDLLVKGNKIYSPETCCFVPREINNLILNNKINRGDLPIGVSFRKNNGKYVAQIKKGEERTQHLGIFDSPEEAFFVYKTTKEAFIKEQAINWKDQIDPKVFQALICYQVEDTD